MWFSIIITLPFITFFILEFLDFPTNSIQQAPLFLWPTALILYSTVCIVAERRMLWAAGARPVSRARWYGPTSGGPFASVGSDQLGGIFILLVALTALLAFILVDSYLRSHSGEGSMPYTLLLLVLAVCASLAVAFWHELWMRERRNGRE